MGERGVKGEDIYIALDPSHTRIQVVNCDASPETAIERENCQVHAFDAERNIKFDGESVERGRIKCKFTILTVSATVNIGILFR